MTETGVARNAGRAAGGQAPGEGEQEGTPATLRLQQVRDPTLFRGAPVQHPGPGLHPQPTGSPIHCHDATEAGTPRQEPSTDVTPGQRL